MPTTVIMPALGVAQEKGTLIKWLRGEGQPVEKGEPLMEVETDKATVEIEAPASGVLAHVSAAEGDEVPVGQPIALILSPGEMASPENKISSPVVKAAPKLAARSKLSPGSEVTQRPAELRGGRRLASPAAKRIAREQGIDLATLRGSGPEGSIVAADVWRARQGREPQIDRTQQAGHLVPLSPMRRIVAQRMMESKQTAPHFYLSMNIDMTSIDEKRKTWQETTDGAIPSINDFIVYACARVLKEFPALNARFTENGIELLPDINIGMAVALEEGLVVPVVCNADRLSLAALARKTRQLIDKAHNKKLLPNDHENGTFTISNLGMLGVDSFTAIINPPQCAILAVGRIARCVVADEVGIAVRLLMTATLSADHRVADGAIAAKFLSAFKGSLETAEFQPDSAIE